MPARQALPLLLLLAAVAVSGCAALPVPGPLPEGDFAAPEPAPLSPAPTGPHPLLFQNIRFGAMPITLYFDTASGEGVQYFGPETLAAARLALALWEARTNGTIRFQEVQSAAAAQVVVQWEGRVNDSEHTLGVGGPVTVDTGRYNVTRQGKVRFASMGYPCLNTVVAVHELGHVLGLDHASDKGSVMYARASCYQNFTPQMLETIAALYKDEPKAEIEVQKAVASAWGGVLSVNFTVRNTGLVAAPRTAALIRTAAGTVASITVEPLEPSVGYAFAAFQSVPKSLEGLEIVVDANKTVSELDEGNNVVRLTAR